MYLFLCVCVWGGGMGVTTWMCWCVWRLDIRCLSQLLLYHIFWNRVSYGTWSSLLSLGQLTREWWGCSTFIIAKMGRVKLERGLNGKSISSKGHWFLAPMWRLTTTCNSSFNGSHSMYVSVYVQVCIHVCLSVCQSVCLSLFLPAEVARFAQRKLSSSYGTHPCLSQGAI